MREAQVLVKSFIYTAAPFGHEDLNGFQFVGLPESGANSDLLDFIARHIGYTPPLNVPSQPDSEEISTQFPVTTRIIPNAPGSFGLVIRTRYVGQVYLTEGARGKWGNFFTHALAVPDEAGSDPVTLLSVARNAKWRVDLSEEEIATGQALNLPDSRVTLDLGAVSALPDSELAAAISAVLARLDGDSPVLLPQISPDNALTYYSAIATALPPSLRRRLSWSSFEFDAGAGYDVIATTGLTRLEENANAYLRLDAPPRDALYVWAGKAAVRDGKSFWAVLSLVQNGIASESILHGLAFLYDVEEVRPENHASVRRMLGIIRDRTPDAELISAARKFFLKGFGALGQSDESNFGFLVAAGEEALALSHWSGSDLVWQELLGWLESCPEIEAAFSAHANPNPLSQAMSRAVGDGLDTAKIVEWVLVAAEKRISDGAPIDALVAAIIENSPRGDAPLLLGLAEKMKGTPAHTQITSALLLLAADREDLAWLDQIVSGLPSINRSLAYSLIPRIRLRMAERRASKAADAPGVASVIANLEIANLDKTDSERVVSIVTKLERALPEVSPKEQIGIAEVIVNSIIELGLDVIMVPNALVIVSSIDLNQSLVLRQDVRLFSNVIQSTHAIIYLKFFDTALTGISSVSLAASASEIKALWRSDIGSHFVSTVSRHFIRNIDRKSAVYHLDDALRADGETKGTGEADPDWSRICKVVAHKICMKVPDDLFDDLHIYHAESPLFKALQRRRQRRLRVIVSSIWTTIGRLTSRRKGGN